MASPTHLSSTRDTNEKTVNDSEPAAIQPKENTSALEILEALSESLPDTIPLAMYIRGHNGKICVRLGIYGKKSSVPALNGSTYICMYVHTTWRFT